MKTQRMYDRNRGRNTPGPATWKRKPLGIAISAIVAGAGGASAAEGTGVGVEPEADRRLAPEVIVVTATKREESLQDVPISVQAVTGYTVQELGIETFDEYVEYLPNVVSAGNGPGKKELYIRGSATEQTGPTVAPAQGSTPGVALYVDELPVSFGARNLDVYAVDLERIEVLSGPQGTLFGESSQSGTVRLITRKPQHGKVATGFNAKFATTADGADTSGASGWLNLPISDALAVRAVVYSDTQGGWVDNVPATFVPSGEVVDRNNVAGYGPDLTGADSVAVARNDALVQDDWNEASYRGGRVGAAWALSDNWDVLVQHTSQTLEAEGSFIVDPNLDQDNATARFSPEYNRDSFGLTTWTLNGRLGQLDLIYTGGTLSRDIDSIIDYTHYNNGGGYITYYLCSGNVYDATDVNNCYDPTKQYMEESSNARTTHEIRVTTDPERRMRLLGGLYINDVETNHVGDFQYASSNPAFAEHVSSYYNDNSGDGFQLGNVSVPTEGINTSGPRSPFTTFFNDFTRTEEQVALFGEVAMDISDAVSVSLSARYYDLTTKLAGAANFSFGCRYGIEPQGFGNSVRTVDGRCNSHAFSNDVTARLVTLGQYNESGSDSVILNARSPNGARDMFRGGGSNQATLAAIKSGHLDIEHLQPDGSVNETDTIMKASISFRPTEDMMLFASYAEGYRPATANRNAGQLSTNQSGVYQNYVVPVVALSDELSSFEIGAKGELLDGFLHLHATYYRNTINELQVSRFDPSNVAFLYFIENVGDAESSGLDVDFQWAVSHQLTVSGSFSLLATELTRLNPQLQGIAVPVGSELPLAPAFAGNVRVRYSFDINAIGGSAYLLGSLSYRTKHVSGIVGNAEFMDDTIFQQSGSYSGLEWQDEGGTFGTVEIDSRLPRNSRFVNPAATTVNVAFGVEQEQWEGWGAELFVNNLTNEDGQIAQVAAHYTPFVSVQRPRTIGFRIFYELD
ncbi:MAG: TonB-dependent receptor [Gammaproteobacteria bacterium]|nr:TonB-dependent receptor [Gammaproteobacteria bacterium]